MESHNIHTVGFPRQRTGFIFYPERLQSRQRASTGWFGERLKCSRAALTENPLRTSLLFAFLHAKPKILIPSCCILSCQREGSARALGCGNSLQSSGEGVRVQNKAADTKSAQHQNSHKLLNSILGQLREEFPALPWIAWPTEHRQLSLPRRAFGILVPCLYIQGEQSTALLSQLKNQSGNHSMVWLEGTLQLISFHPPAMGYISGPLITFH